MIKDFTKIFCLWLFISFIRGQQIPTLFQYPVNMVNGSNKTGNCTNLIENVCHNSTSSVLFDGIIPTLTGLDGNMWASQLLTINSDYTITFSFTAKPNFLGVRRVEIVLFNCPDWRISVQSITLQTGVVGVAGTINPRIFSCDSLVRVCLGNLNTNRAQTQLTLRFTTINPNYWVHIAEVTFYGDGPTCPTEAIITTRPTDSFTTMIVPLSATNETATPSATLFSTTTETDTATQDATITITNNSGAIAGGIVVTILVIITIVLVIFIFIFFRRHKGNNFKNFKQGLKTNATKDLDIDMKAGTVPVESQLKQQGSASKPLQWASQQQVEQMYTVVNKLNNHKPLQQPLEEKGPSSLVEQTYAVVNKPKHHNPLKQPEVTPQQLAPLVEQMYSMVDKPKHHKPPEVPPPWQPSQQQPVQQEQPPSIEQMYAAVDKQKHLKPPVQQEVSPSEQSSQQALNQVYAVVNKPKS